MASKPDLRVVEKGEKPADKKPMSLLEAIDSDDVLAIMKAQRRIVGEALVTAADNVRPQYNNELSKLNALIREEEARRNPDQPQPDEGSVVVPLDVQAWDGTGF